MLRSPLLRIEVKKLEGEREFYNSIFLEEDSFYIHIDEQLHATYVSSNMERMTGLTDKRVFADVDVLRNLMDKVEVRNNLMKIEE